MPGPELRVIGGPADGTTIPFGDEPFVIGRGQEAAGRLGDDPELSRRHARVYKQSGRVIVEDLGSMNGTFVNGRRIDEPTVVSGGDSIEVGGTTHSGGSTTRSG